MHTHFGVEDFKSSNAWLYWAAEKEMGLNYLLDLN